MRVLGAILAGGAARRFGSDKAAALVAGTPLIEHVAAALRSQCAALVVVGRSWPGLARIEDRPTPGLGPLGGLAGALAHARAEGFDAVLTSGCDLPGLPADFGGALAPAPAVVAGQPLLGLWPAELAARLDDYLCETEDRSMRGWIDTAGARRVRIGAEVANINTPADLAAYLRVLTRPPEDPRSSP